MYVDESPMGIRYASVFAEVFHSIVVILSVHNVLTITILYFLNSHFFAYVLFRRNKHGSQCYVFHQRFDKRSCLLQKSNCCSLQEDQTACRNLDSSDTWSSRIMQSISLSYIDGLFVSNSTCRCYYTHEQ